MLVLVVLLLTISGGVMFALVYARMETPNLVHLRAGRHPNLGLATLVYSADGHELTRYYRENRTWIAYAQLSPALVETLIATEDRRFYTHRGVDWLRLGASMWKTARGQRQGGSTLTMQLARNYFPDIGQAPAVQRKFYEIATALKIERGYLKYEILEMYLNTVPFGYHAFGIETAAQTYFNKSASALNTVESATLVGMLKGITLYNPVRHPERSIQRRNVVLGQANRYGSLDPGALDSLRRQPLGLDFQFNTAATGPAPHFAETVRTGLADWAAEQGYDLYSSGLRVYTTLDMRLQAKAEAAFEAQLNGLQAVAGYEWSRRRPAHLGDTPDVYERAQAAGRYEPFAYFRRARRDLLDQHIRHTERYEQALRQGTASDAALEALHANVAFIDSLVGDLTRLEAGLVALDPATGHVLAWVGGCDFAEDQYDKVALARRQPGSTFKPFVYAAALELGYSPEDQRVDVIQTYDTTGPDKTWTPTNSGDEATGDTLTLREGLAFSKNTITAQLMDEMGPAWVAHTARRMGIESPLDEVPSLALGTSEVTLLELVAAYTPLATNGWRRTPLFITRIEDRNGRPIASFAPETRASISSQTSYSILEMMRGVVDEGTGIRIRTQFGIEADVAGKTGTTQNNADGWFVLLHPRLAMGAWVGFNDRQVTFRSNFWGQGGHNALYVVGDFLKRALADSLVQPDARFAPPHGHQPPRPADSLAADSLHLLAEADTMPPAWRPDDVEGVLRSAVSRSLTTDTTRLNLPDTALAAHTDSTHHVPFLAPIDSTRRRPPATPQNQSDTNLEQTMRQLLFPETSATQDSSGTQRDQ